MRFKVDNSPKTPKGNAFGQHQRNLTTIPKARYREQTSDQ